ncbi:MAG: hypothetical protein IK130_10820 [Oscillospiraceae bacterium]|nr:hypothetical protein [Oscillospiraceae bacterium]
MKTSKLGAFLAAAMLTLTGCGARKTYDDIQMPAAEKSTLVPVGNWNTGNDYEGVPAVKEETKATFSSADGLCRIEVKEHYFDVTLDLTGGDHFAAGAAYSEALKLAYSGYEEMIENYLYDCMQMVYSEPEALQEAGITDKYELIRTRLHTLKAALPEEYQQELNGFASHFSPQSASFSKNGQLSQDECDLISLIPDVMREAACSGMIVGGSRTASGKRMVSRLMEWDLGSGNSMCDGHCVLRFKNGDKSFVSVCSVGQLDVTTGMNDDGVFAAILDVGSYEPFGDCAGKISYTYSVREALETCTTAKAIGTYLNGLTPKFTFNHNVIVTDEQDGFIAENCHLEDAGRPLMRDETTPLLDNLSWDAEGCICVVNAFAAAGQLDLMTNVSGNLLRWMKYDRLFSGSEKITLSRFKSLMTSEKTDNAFAEIRSNQLVYMVLVDYDSRTLQCTFTGKNGLADMPDFLDLGTF